MDDTQNIEENISCVERFYAACMERNWEKAFSLVSREVKYQHPRFKKPRGFVTLQRHFEGFLGAFPDAQREVLLRLGQGNWVCVETQWCGTNTKPFVRPSGRSTPATQNAIDSTVLGVFKIEEGTITEMRLYEDLLSLRRQLRRQRR